MSICPTCGGNFDPRFVDEPCPTCGKQYGRAVMKKAVKMNVAKSSNLNIPQNYIGKEWSKALLLESKKSDKNQPMLNRLANLMELIHESFAAGKLPPGSAMIIAPPNYSKVTWAFSCMQLAQAKGMTVAPFLDTVELNRFMMIAADKPFHKIYKLMDYESYITADVCFVTVTKTYKNQEAFRIIVELLDTRSRKGLPTFFISRFDLSTLCKWDNLGHFNALKEQHFSEDKNKLPVVCQYFK